jgi:RNA polymerase sigma-70 factor (ECF subfamily)
LTWSANGDAAAFTHLVKAHSSALHGYFARRMPAAWEDLLADTWLQAFAARRTFDPARFGPGPAVRGRAQRARPVSASGEARRARAGAGCHRPLAAGGPQRLDAAALAPALRRALAELPSGERELLLLISWEQLTPTEAAAVVGIPAGTARPRLYRARGRLRDDLTVSRPAGRNLTAAGPSKGKVTHDAVLSAGFTDKIG